LDYNWKTVFRKAISIYGKPTNSDLEKIVNLQELNCSENEISDLEPLRALTMLQELDCRKNKLSNLELDKFKKAMPNCKVYS
jgi:Leucine-rich repeat (LRR) protein